MFLTLAGKRFCVTESMYTDVYAIDEEKFLCDNIQLSCQDIYNKNNSATSGVYVIDIDGKDGSNNPFPVSCKFDVQQDNKVDVWTVIHHDSEERTFVRSHIDGPGGYHKNVTYDGLTRYQMEALINNSKSCRQFIRWECEGAAFTFSDRPFTWWVSRDLQPQYYWGGATENFTCGCYPNCSKANVKCNCDMNERFTWSEDSGYLQDISQLPVTQLWFGDTSGTGESGYYTLGPLECEDKPGTCIKTLICTSHFVSDDIICVNARIRLCSPYRKHSGQGIALLIAKYLR